MRFFPHWATAIRNAKTNRNGQTQFRATLAKFNSEQNLRVLYEFKAPIQCPFLLQYDMKLYDRSSFLHYNKNSVTYSRHWRTPIFCPHHKRVRRSWRSNCCLEPVYRWRCHHRPPDSAALLTSHPPPVWNCSELEGEVGKTTYDNRACFGGDH